MKYKEWEGKVNELMLELHGVGVDDIPDMPYRDWYNAGWVIDEAVEEAINTVNEGGF